MSQKLFPPYLNEGSYGSAVVFLQQLLSSIGIMTPPLEITGEHTGRSVEAVIRLKRDWLFLTGDDVNGNFGPFTRQCLEDELRIDVELIQCALGDVTYWTGPNHQGVKSWPEQPR